MMARALCAVLLVLSTLSSFAEGRELAPRDLGPTSYDTRVPAIGSAGGRFLTAWREDRLGYGKHVFGSLSDASGKRLSPEPFMILANASPIWMQLVGTGDTFALFWGPSTKETYLTDLDLDGRVLATRRLALPENVIRKFAWNGTRFLAALSLQYDGRGRLGEAELLTRGGEIIRKGIALRSNIFALDIAMVGEAFVVVTATGGFSLMAHRIESDGSVESMILGPMSIVARNQSQIAIAGRSDGTVLLAWAATGGLGAIGTGILESSGEVRDVRSIRIDGVSLEPVHLARRGNGYELTALLPVRSPTSAVITNVLHTITLDESGRQVGSIVKSETIGPRGFAFASNDAVTVAAYLPAEAEPQRVRQLAIGGTPEVVSRARARQFQPAIAAGGGQLLAAFSERGETTRVRTASLTADGDPISSSFAGNDSLLLSRDIAWNGVEYLAVYAGTSLLAQRLTVDGEASGDPIVIDSAAPQAVAAAVAWAVDRWVVIWAPSAGDAAPRLVTVFTNGIISAPVDLPLATPRQPQWTRHITSMAITAKETRIVIAWIETQKPPAAAAMFQGERTSYAMNFRRDGRAVDAAPIQLAGNATHVALASSGQETVALTNADSATIVTVVETGASASLPAGLSDIVWDGRDYAIATRYRPDRPRHLVVSRLDPALQEVSQPRAVVTLQSDYVAPPSLAAVSSGEAFVGIQEGDVMTGARAVVYVERDMEVLQASPPRRRAVR